MGIEVDDAVPGALISANATPVEINAGGYAHAPRRLELRFAKRSRHRKLAPACSLLSVHTADPTPISASTSAS